MPVQVQSEAAKTAAFASPEFNIGWALRRTVLLLLILGIGVGSLAWLTHASIDPALEPAIDQPR